MKKSLVLSLVVLLSGLLALPVLAENSGKGTTPPTAEQVQKKTGQPPAAQESKGRKLHRDYQQKREKARQHRDEMLKQREQAVQSQG